jgi:uncharacterized membrane protein YeaQ/YmgE (transglycosylase-associated protein family)
MYLSNQSLLVIVVVGIVAGWLAGKVVEGGGFGLIWDLIVGLIGAFIGDWLLPRLGIHLGTGIVAGHQCLRWRRRAAADSAPCQRLARWTEVGSTVVKRATI